MLRLVGDASKNAASLNPAHTVYSVKRLIGRQFRTPEVARDAKMVPFKVVERNSKPYVEVGRRVCQAFGCVLVCTDRNSHASAVHR